MGWKYRKTATREREREGRRRMSEKGGKGEREGRGGMPRINATETGRTEAENSRRITRSRSPDRGFNVTRNNPRSPSDILPLSLPSSPLALRFPSSSSLAIDDIHACQV